MIGVKGNLDVHSGKPVLDVIPSMIIQAGELIVKTLRTQKSVEEIDRIKKDRIAQNPDDWSGCEAAKAIAQTASKGGNWA